MDERARRSIVALSAALSVLIIALAVAFPDATWEDVEEVLIKVERAATEVMYEAAARHIRSNVLPLVRG